jgi:glucosamine kinase
LNSIINSRGPRIKPHNRPMTDLLAVDAGGTSTRAIVLTPDGDCRGFGRAGSGNPISSGPDHAARELVAAVREALEQASSRGSDGVAVFAMAGAGSRVPMDSIAVQLGRVGVLGELRLESDLLATFCSGAWELDGYAVVAGTGAAAIRVEGGRQVAVADGLGWLLGDAGSGFGIGRRIVRAVAADLDRRGPTTSLTALLLAELGIASEGEPTGMGRPASLGLLVDAVYALRPIDLARFAPLVFMAGEDEVAAAIRDDARAALRTSLAAVRTAEVAGPVVGGGGVLGALGLPGVDLHPVVDGAVGAAVLALRANGIVVDRPMFERMRDSLAALRP